MKFIFILCFYFFKPNFSFSFPSDNYKKDTLFYNMNIFWYFGKGELHEQCYSEMDSIINVYKQQNMKKIFIEIYQNENPKMSYSPLNRRKKSILNYFLQKGINSNHINIKTFSVKNKNAYRKNVKNLSENEIQEKHNTFYPLVFIAFSIL